MSASIYIGLVHYPIYNKHYEIITTSVTNYDVHDIARAARTYDISSYYIIHNVIEQQNLIKDVMAHWQKGFGSTYNADRKDAFANVEIANSLRQAVEDIQSKEGQKPIIITTDARTYENTISYKDLRFKIEHDTKPIFILFGTGYGMTKEMMKDFDYILEPIHGHSIYNHLSVRSAVSIILDRLRGAEWWK